MKFGTFVCFSQLTLLIERETFVWWVDPIIGRVEWRFTGPVHGLLCLIAHGPPVMPKLCADNLAIPLKVR